MCILIFGPESNIENLTGDEEVFTRDNPLLDRCMLRLARATCVLPLQFNRIGIPGCRHCQPRFHTNRHGADCSVIEPSFKTINWVCLSPLRLNHDSDILLGHGVDRAIVMERPATVCAMSVRMKSGLTVSTSWYSDPVKLER